MTHAEQELLARLRRTRRPSAAATRAQAPHLGASLDAREIYNGLLQEQPDPALHVQSKEFLIQQLAATEPLSDNLPADIEDLMPWMQSNTMTTGKQYQQYLHERQAGAPRRYFRSKAHALYFLQGVAPTKLVDGSWLYGLLKQWRDPRYLELIRIYLEELGDGEDDKNHVVLYRKLLATHDCTRWRALPPEYFLQGAIQLALAEHTAEFLPEVIGFNLGYEQLPLHLLICSYELRELGIDPYYFTLHVTIDNAGSGHAARAVQAVFDAMPDHADREAFYRRLKRGYRLNDLGISTNKVIDSFQLEQEVVAILNTKATVGAFLHSDYCRLGGKTVNEWLSPPGQIPAFLATLQQVGWIKRHEDPTNSRFWQLLEGEKAPMFGVFNAYERQVIHDWIAGDQVSDGSGSTPAERQKALPAWRLRVIGQSAGAQKAPGPNGEHGATDRRATGSDAGSGSGSGSGSDAGARPGPSPENEFDLELQQLQKQLNEAKSCAEALDTLLPWLSPAQHHSRAGLHATRLFSRWLTT